MLGPIKTCPAKGIVELFLANMNNFNSQVGIILGNEFKDIGADVAVRFSTEKVKDREGKEIFWLDYNYKGFPLVASLTKFTQIQADIKTTKYQDSGNYHTTWNRHHLGRQGSLL